MGQLGLDNMQTSSEDARPGALRRWLGQLRNYPMLAWVLLIVSIIATAFAWYVSNTHVMQDAHNRFIADVEDAKARIANRMREQEQVLRGGVGLIKSSDHVSRAQWAKYVHALELSTRFPGLQGLGFAKLVPPGAAMQIVAEAQQDGLAAFKIWPQGQRPVTTTILYLEPLDWRNKRALGYDMYSEPSRRAAMNRARDTGEVAISAMTTLVQETDEDVQNGFLMYLPVYRHGAMARTVAERRNALTGFVFSPFRMGDLMHGVLGTQLGDLTLHIFDDTQPDHQHCLYSNTHSCDVKHTHPDGAHEFEHLSSLLIGGRPWTVHFQANSSYLPLSDRAQPFMIAAAGLIIDILAFLLIGSLAGRHRAATILASRAANQLLNNAAHTQAIVETVTDGIVTIDGAHKIRTINKAAVHIFGYAPEEMIGADAGILISDEALPQIFDAMDTYFTQGDTSKLSTLLEIEGKRKNAERFAMEVIVSPMSMYDQRCVAAVYRDVSERTQVNHMKREFISTVSHELRTPLTSLVGSLGLLNDGRLGTLPEKARMLVQVASNNAKRLARLVNDILDAEKLESGRLEMQFRVVDLVALARQALDEIAGYAGQFKVSTRLEHEDEQIYVLADPLRMMQVFTNLLANAIRYSPEHGDVLVSIRRQGGDTAVRVIDQGPGIPPHMRDKIFERFVQVDGSDTRSHGGTGLGLTITKNIITRHNGSIQVEAGAASGTTICFILQACATPQMIGAASGNHHELTVPALRA